MKRDPLVSVIIPVYNQGEFILETLESLFGQTYKNFECIVVNDGSTDNSETIIQKYIEIYPEIKYYSKENSGVSESRNIGFQISKGEYVMFLDGDDLIDSEYIQKAIDIFIQYPELDLVYGEAAFFGDRVGQWYLPTYSYKNMLKGNCIYIGCIMSREVLNGSLLFDSNLHAGFEDWDFFIRNLEDKQVYRIPEILFYYRIKNISRMSNLNRDKLRSLETIKFILEKNKAIYKKYCYSYYLLKMMYLNFKILLYKKINE